eukprot:4585922-Lingulodinium_polyedra.AAC.1
MLPSPDSAIGAADVPDALGDVPMATIAELAPAGDGSDGRLTKDNKPGDYLGGAAQEQGGELYGASRYARDLDTIE